MKTNLIKNELVVPNNGSNVQPITTGFCQTLFANARQDEFHGYRFALIPISLLVVNERYQRKINEGHVNLLISKWDRDLCDALMVNFRDDAFHVIDGQHRFEAAKRLGLVSLPCQIYHNLQEEEEAVRFARQDENRKTLSSFDRFKSLVCAKDEVALSVKRICDKYHVTYVKQAPGTPGTLGGTDTVMRIYASHGSEMVQNIFQLIEKLGWHGYRNGYANYILRAFKNLFLVSEDIEQTMELVVQLCKGNSPNEVLHQAQREHPGAKGPTAAVTAFLDQYALS